MSAPQGLETGLFLLQYGNSAPEVPELSSYRKPGVMFRRSGGLALTGDNLYKKSLTESSGARQVGTSQSMALGSGLVSTSAANLRIPGDLRLTSLARVVGALPGSTFFSRRSRDIFCEDC